MIKAVFEVDVGLPAVKRPSLRVTKPRASPIRNGMEGCWASFWPPELR